MWANQGGEARIYDPDAGQRADALAFAARELPEVVRLVDGAPGRVTAHAEMEAAVDGSWMVVEAIPERLDAKRELFGVLDRMTSGDCILASNSSSYPTSQMIDHVTHRHRVVNTHYYLPPRLNAVEIMSDGETDPGVIDLLMTRAPLHGLVPFHVRNESVGFIYNRIWAAIKREALEVVWQGASTPADVDRIFRLSMDAPTGPFRRMDEVGLDVVLDIEEHYAEMNPSLPEGPRLLLRKYVDDGRLGKKTGRGFYDDYDA
jgi:3-hydroxybutyryl-CoA dehydrogenase